MVLLDELGNPIVQGAPNTWVPEDVPVAQQPDYGWALAQYSRQQSGHASRLRQDFAFRRNREEMDMLDRLEPRIRGNAPQSTHVVEHTRAQVHNITKAADHRERATLSTIPGIRHKAREVQYHRRAQGSEKRRTSSEEAAEVAARARDTTAAMNAEGSNYRQGSRPVTSPTQASVPQYEPYITRHREQVVTRSTNHHLPSYHPDAPYSCPGPSQPPHGQNMGQFHSATAVYYHPGPNPYPSQQGSQSHPTHVPTQASGPAPGQYYYAPPHGYPSR